MPSFDITSEVNTQELDNAINQARKELSTRFDFRGFQHVAGGKLVALKHVELREQVEGDPKDVEAEKAVAKRRRELAQQVSIQ